MTNVIEMWFLDVGLFSNVGTDLNLSVKKELIG